MGADGDRLRRAFSAAVASTDPLAPYGCLYRARVVGQSTDRQRVDVEPVDKALLPSIPGVPLRTGVPGVTVLVGAGAYVLVGWEDRDPQRPFAALWSHPSAMNATDATGGEGTGGVVSEVTIAPSVRFQIGGPGVAAQALVKGTAAWELEQEFVQALIGAFTTLAGSAIGDAAPLIAGFNNAAIDLQNYLAKKQAQKGCLSELGFITK